jgi:Ser/Thr protein kinase RdoA (MazF antagonist)
VIETVSDAAIEELLKQAAAAYGLADVRLVDRVKANVLRVASSAGELAVKLFELGQRHEAERETDLLVHLQPPDAAYRVQRLLRTAGDEAVAELSGHRVVVTDWIAGQFKVYTAITDTEWHALGKQLGALHVRLQTFGSARMQSLTALLHTRDFGIERASIAGLRDLVPEGMRDHVDTMLAALDAHGAATLAKDDLVEHPIHNDYNQFNYVFDGRLPPVILDWEGAIIAPQAYEVVRCLNHLPLVAPDHARAFMTGYREIRALDAAALAWAVDASLVDHALKRWPIDRFLAGHADAEASVRRSAEVLRVLVEGIAALRAFYASYAGRA